MRTVTFYADTNRSGDLLHIETDGAIINIRVGLTDREGRQVTRVDVLPDDAKRGGQWQADAGDKAVVVRKRGGKKREGMATHD